MKTVRASIRAANLQQLQQICWDVSSSSEILNIYHRSGLVKYFSYTWALLPRFLFLSPCRLLFLSDTYTPLINSIMEQLMKILSKAVFKQAPIVLADIIGRDVLRRCVVIMAPGLARAIMPPVIIKWELSFVRTLMRWRVLSHGSRIMLKVLFRVLPLRSAMHVYFGSNKTRAGIRARVRVHAQACASPESRSISHYSFRSSLSRATWN